MTIKSDINKFEKKVRGKITLVAGSKKLLREIGVIATAIIKRRTRAGFGVSEPLGRRSKLKGLAPSTIRARASSKRLNTSLTSPKRSNLTFTGALINSLRVVSVSSNPAEVVIDANKRRRKGGLTNEELAEIVSDQCREFLNLSRREFDRVRSAFNKSYKQQFKKSVRS